VIVSVPKIAVTATSTTALVSGAALSGKFSDALSSVAGDISALLPEKTGAGTGATSKTNVTGKPDAKSLSKSSKADVDSSKPDAPIAVVPPTIKENLILPISVPGIPHLPTPLSGTPEGDSDSGSDDEAQPLKTPAAVTSQLVTTTAFVPPFAMQASTVPMTSTIPGRTSDPVQAPPASAGEPDRMVTSTDGKTPTTSHAPKADVVPPLANTKTASAPVAVAANVTPRASAPSPAPDAKVVLRDGDKSPKPAEKHAAAESSPTQPHALDVAAKAASPVAATPAIEAAKTTTKILPLATTGRNVAGKSDSGIVPPSSQSPKRDGDAAKNPPPSDKLNPAPAARPTTESVTAPPPQGGTGFANNAPATIVASVESKPAASPTTPNLGNRAQPSSQVATAIAKSDVNLEPAPHTSPLQVARLIERAGQTELRVGIQAGEFGNVGIRTSMAHSQFSAEISVERGELGRVLSAELPALHDRLAEQRVPVSNIVLQDHSAGSNSDLRQGARQNHYSQQNSTFTPEEADTRIPASAIENTGNEAGLDLHM